MDIVNIESKMLKGRVTAPPSKSVAHRAIIAAALSGGECTVSNLSFSEDIKATLRCMRELGAEFQVVEEENKVVFKKSRDVEEGDVHILDCSESGSTLRFLIPVALLSDNPVTLMGRGRLMQRPQKPYMDLFSKKGIECIQTCDTLSFKGKLTPGVFRLPGNVSSQFITGLLFALPLLNGDSEIVITTETESKGYIDITLSVLKDFGIEVINNNYKKFKVAGNQKYKAVDYEVEGDYSQAAFFLTAGALGCDIECVGLREDSLQGDKKILDVLKETGAAVTRLENGAIKVKRTENMRGITVDASEIPDLVPIIAVLCGFCKGESRIINAGRLRMKESDRLAAISSELKHLGLDITEGTDYLIINGTDILHGTTVSSWNDHRIAMALSIAACRCEGEVSITGAQTAVLKSYPDFFEVYNSVYKGPEPLMKYMEELR